MTIMDVLIILGLSTAIFFLCVFVVICLMSLFRQPGKNETDKTPDQTVNQ